MDQALEPGQPEAKVPVLAWCTNCLRPVNEDERESLYRRPVFMGAGAPLYGYSACPFCENGQKDSHAIMQRDWLYAPLIYIVRLPTFLLGISALLLPLAIYGAWSIVTWL